MAASGNKYDFNEFKILKTGGDPRMQLFEENLKKCIDEGRDDVWTEKIEVEFVNMRDYEANEID